MLLSDADIREFMASGDIEISDFSERLEPASYDLCVGTQGVTPAGMQAIDPDHPIRIPRGATVVVAPQEHLRLSRRIAGSFGLRSSLARSGLILLSGPQIDPGFNGPLSITIYNAGSSEAILSHGQRFVTVVFSLLRSDATREYSGRYQGQTPISSEEVAAVTQLGINLSELENKVQKMHLKYSTLSNLMFFVVFAIVVGCTVVIVSKLVDSTSPASDATPTPVLVSSKTPVAGHRGAAAVPSVRVSYGPNKHLAGRRPGAARSDKR